MILKERSFDIAKVLRRLMHLNFAIGRVEYIYGNLHHHISSHWTILSLNYVDIHPGTVISGTLSRVKYRIFSKISRAYFKLTRFLDMLIFESCLFSSHAYFQKSENCMKEIISSLCFKNVLIE